MKLLSLSPRKAAAPLWTALAAALLSTVAPSAYAQSPPAARSPGAARALSQAQRKAQLAEQVKQALESIVPAGERLRSVRLECAPPAGATIKQVAPGVESLSSPGFTVELDSPTGVVYCSATANVEEPVLVAARSLSVGQTVTTADFRMGWADAFMGNTDTFSNFEGRAVMLVSLRAGSVAHASEMRKAILIRAGDIVAVTVRNGPVTVLTHLKAVNDAGDGESVTLENPTSGRQVAARAAGPGVAQIDLK